jgi:ATP-dependent RNA helicase SUPV3L1/SUV3
LTETPKTDAPAAATEATPAEPPAAETPIELGLGGADAQTDEPITNEAAPSEPVAEAAVEMPAAEQAAVAGNAAPAEPTLMDVWRPGRMEGPRRPPRRPKPARREVKIPDAPSAAATAGETVTPTPAAEQKPRREREQRRPPRRKEGPRRVERPIEQHARAPRERDRPIDPNSPFAALLELKARLEAKPKE